MKKENIVELNIGVYESIKLKVNRIIAMDIASKFPELSKMKSEKDIEIETLYSMSIYALYKMAKSLDKEFTYEKAEEIFEYASNVITVIDGEKQPCNLVLMTRVLNFLQEVFTNVEGEEVQVVDFKME
jgi:hypothetical protein